MRALISTFNKSGKNLGLGYPAGPEIDRRAQLGNPKAYKFTKPKVAGLNFSFSGLKTALLYFVQRETKNDPNFVKEHLNDICASLQYTIIGILIDKLTGRKLIPIHLLPMLAIFIVMLFSDHVYVLYLYMAGLGLSNGFTENISNSLWAEMYGVKNLGSIKAMLTFFGIMASASSPFLYGIILDQTNSINTLVYLSLILIILFSLMGYFSKKLK